MVRDTDGMVRLEARLYADEAALVMKAVDLARDASAEASAPDAASALVQVAESFIAAPPSADAAPLRPGGERHQILVCVKEDPLMPDGVSAEASPTGAAVPPVTLRRLACDASITEVTVDAEGTPLAIAKKTRTIALHPARAARARWWLSFPGLHPPPLARRPSHRALGRRWRDDP
ncbi:MAG: hypothetical protein U1F43_24315 [Myxococcota bacterium]